MNFGAPRDRWLFVPLPVGEEEGWIMWMGHPAENKPDAHNDPVIKTGCPLSTVKSPV